MYLAKVGPFYKVGCTSSLRQRRYNLQAETSLPVKFLFAREGGHCLENKIHRRLRKYLVFGREWYEFKKADFNKALRVFERTDYVISRRDSCRV